MRATLLLSLILLVTLAQAGEVKVDYYYQTGCVHCAAFEKVLGEVQGEGKYQLNVTSYEVRFDPAGRQRFMDVIKQFNVPPEQQGTPLVVLGGNSYFVGDISKADFKAKLDRCLSGDCGGTDGEDGRKVILNPLTVFFAGLISGFNPCLFAVLLFLISYSLGMSENKTRLVKLTLAFSFGIFAAYFIIGFGLLSFASSINMNAVTLVVAAIVILLGLWTLKDYRNPKSILVETPENIKGMSESLTRKNSAVSAFFLGAIFSLVKAPCVGGIYLTILNMASSANPGDRLSSIPLLAAYNLGLIFPLLFISGAVMFGVPPKAIEEWREKNKFGMRIFLGLALILVGLIMLWEQRLI